MNFNGIFRKNVNYDNLKPLSANPTKWSNTLKQFVGKLPANCLSVFDQFVGLELKGLKVDKNQVFKYSNTGVSGMTKVL